MKKGPTRIRTGVVRIKTESDNHYTMEPANTACNIVTWCTKLINCRIWGLRIGEHITYHQSYIEVYSYQDPVVWPRLSVSEWHLLFPKARTPTTSRFIYTTQVFEGRSVSERTSKHDHMTGALRSNTRLQYDHVTQNIGPIRWKYGAEWSALSV